MEIIPKNVNKIRITDRPIAVPYNYRISYKVSQILLILDKCSKRGACSLEKLQIICHIFISDKAQKDLLNYIQNGTGVFVIRFDPTVNRSINFAIAEKLIARNSKGRFNLTDKGKAVIKEIEKDDELFKYEKTILGVVGSKLTEKKIENVISAWGGIND
ncbi:MAG: hypothetical protein ACLSH8_04035 [Zhenhengia sp.]|uniref:hypothetical protein n=1 Tax=Zhenhengia sp. TaxID=2944208 RepID=UPI003994E039